MAITAALFAWQDRAACRGHGDLFFGPDIETEAGQQVRESAAKTICTACPVRSACLDSTLVIPAAAGVWGGLGETELRKWRRAERRRQRQAAA